MKHVPISKVQARLELEAARLNAGHRGIHIFKPIWRVSDPVCNWSTSYERRGNHTSFDEMRRAIERVQRDMPLVDFDQVPLRDLITK